MGVSWRCTPLGVPGRDADWIADYWARVGAVFGARWAILVGGIASLGIALICGAWAMIHWKGRVAVRPSFPWVGVEGGSSADAPRRSVDPS